MENFIRTPLKNYQIRINYIRHISYDIKLCINVTMEGFDKGLSPRWWTIRNHCGLNYGTVGLDFVNSGGQGGTFNAAGKPWETSLICWYRCLCNSFGFSSGVYVVFISRVFMLHGEIVFPFLDRYALNMVLPHYIVYLLQLSFTILLIALHVWFAGDKGDLKRGLTVGLWMVYATF